MVYNDKLKDRLLDSLFEGILKLKNIDECYRFFEDLCTVAEIKSMGQRFEVARMLEENHTFAEIVSSTGASTATISRVKRALYFGADGYKIILGRMRKNKNNE
ncbi:MAG: YerC/YecD family TrpR-related protein [Bacillota bacterium]